MVGRTRLSTCDYRVVMRKTSPWFRLPILIWIGVVVSLIILTIGLVAQQGFDRYLGAPAAIGGLVVLLALVVWCVAALRR